MLRFGLLACFGAAIATSLSAGSAKPPTTMVPPPSASNSLGSEAPAAPQPGPVRVRTPSRTWSGQRPKLLIPDAASGYSPAEWRALALLAPAASANPTQVPVRDARAAVEARPRDPDLWFQLGESLSVAGDVQGAVAAYRQATRLPPKIIGRAFLYRDVAEALEKAGALDEALAAARVSVKSWPLSKEPLFCGGVEVELLTRLLVKLHNAKAAADFYGPLAARQPTRDWCRSIQDALLAAQ